MNRVRKSVLAIAAGALLATSLGTPPAAAKAPPGTTVKTGTVVKAAPTAGRTVSRPAWLKPRRVSAAQAPAARSTSAQAAACDAWAIGGWGYNDQAGAWHNLMNFQVEVWDVEVGLLTVGYTDADGKYDLCFPSAYGKNIYLIFRATNPHWLVGPVSGAPYAWQTWTVAVTPGSGPTSFGVLTVPQEGQRILYAFDQANDAWLFLPKPINGCFDQYDGRCRPLQIVWTSWPTGGHYYDPGVNELRLAVTDPDNRLLVVHGIAQAIMDDVYEDAYPAPAGCPARTPKGTTSAACAWVDGFADWFAASVYRERLIHWPDGSTFDLETGSWHTDWARGDRNELRVAAALYDLVDTTDLDYLGPWDNYGEGTANIWYTFTHHADASFADFWASRTADGFDVTDRALGSLYQNTIDYRYREPLVHFVPRTRNLTAPAPHHYGYSPDNMWSVVAIRPQTGSDYDLRVYEDRALTSLIGRSALGGTAIDFVAVDHTEGQTGPVFPQAYPFIGTGSYEIEMDQDAGYCRTTSTTVTFASNNLAWLCVAQIAPGETVSCSVTPAAGQNASLFVLDSGQGRAAGRANAVASATGQPAGTAESVTFTATRLDHYAFVVLNESGSGSAAIGCTSTRPRPWLS